MYRDELGNIWGSEEDCASYCKNVNIEEFVNIYKKTIEKIIDNNKLGTIYIDKNGKYWTSEKVYKDSLEERVTE